MEDEDIYDIAPCDEKPVAFKALKNTWNMMGPGPQSPPSSGPKPSWMKPADSNEVNTTPKPYLPPKKGPQLLVSLDDVKGQKKSLNYVQDKRESARTSKIAIPDAFKREHPANSQNKPVVSPKPVVMRKPTANGTAVRDPASPPPALPAKGGSSSKGSGTAQRKTLMPPDNSPPPPPTSKPPPAIPVETEKSSPVGLDRKKSTSPEMTQKSISSEETGKSDEDGSQPALKPGQTVTSADGKTYILRPLPAVKGVGPIKPQRPPNVNLPMGSIVGVYDEDEELYDEVGVMPETNRPRASVRPVSAISEYTEEEEDRFEGQKSTRKSAAVARESTIDDDLYDTVDIMTKEEPGEIYDDDMVLNPASRQDDKTISDSTKTNGEVKDDEDLELYDDIVNTSM